MTIARVVVVAMVTGCISPVMHFGEGKTPKQAQHDTMRDLGPARLATGRKWAGEIATRKIRVWADNQFRAQNRGWREAFEQPLGLANLVVTPVFGVKLVAEYSAWEHQVPDARLEEHLAALIAHDPGDDVFAVVGLTSSLPLVSSTFEDLGMATLGGRHLVMRGYADLEERKLYADAFPDLRPEERELALVHLRHHKTAVVLLHELGHILGFAHEDDTNTIMNAFYSSRATAFSERARAVLLRAIDQRLGRSSPTPETAKPETASVEGKRAAPVHAPIVIRITKAGHTLVDGKRIMAEALERLLTDSFAQDPATTIVIRKDRDVPSGMLAAVLDRAKAIGLTKFEFSSTGR